MVMNEKSLEVYVNGRLVDTISLFGYPLPANGNLHITPNGKGYPGKLAYVQYFNTPIGAQRINRLYKYYLKEIKKCSGYIPAHIHDNDDDHDPVLCLKCVYE